MKTPSVEICMNIVLTKITTQQVFMEMFLLEFWFHFTIEYIARHTELDIRCIRNENVKFIILLKRLTNEFQLWL